MAVLDVRRLVGSGVGNAPERHAVLCGWQAPIFPKGKASAKNNKPGKAAVNDKGLNTSPGLQLYYTLPGPLAITAPE